MKSLFLYSILLICISLETAFANINQRFEEFYYSGHISSRHCGQNIHNFIKFLVQTGDYDSRTKVLYFEAPSNRWSFGKVVAVNSRWGKNIDGNFHENWSHHVIAVRDGLVYDFSFSRSPRILPLMDYFEEMYVPVRPFAIYGLDFRVGGDGPYYSASHARKELENFKFKITTVSSNGREAIERKEFNYRDMLRYLGTISK
jgi:hypothetical protein